MFIFNGAATDTILDIGCGGGRTIATLAEKTVQGRVYGIDHSEDCVALSKEYISIFHNMENWLLANYELSN